MVRAAVCVLTLVVTVHVADPNSRIAFRFFVRVTACPSQKRALEDDGDIPVVEEHVAKRRDTKPDVQIRVLVVEG
jgi:hypothetical protein